MKPVLAPGAVLGVIALVMVGGAIYVAERVRAGALAVDGTASSSYPLKIQAIDDVAVTLDPRDAPHLLETELIGLRWEGGEARLGPVLASSEVAVTRRIDRLSGEMPEPGVGARLEGNPYGDDPGTGLDIDFEDITYPGPLGPTDAWFIPGDRDTWAVLVHGRGSDRDETLRLLRPIVDAGMPALSIRYRNDPDSPSDGGIARFGQSEWQDLAAAIELARERGAQRVVIAGVSMGGAIALAYSEEGPAEPALAGLILDAPVLDLSATIESRGRDVLGPLAGFGLLGFGREIAARRHNIDWSQIDYLSRAEEFDVPILLFHDRDDTLVPIDASDALAAWRPDLVRYEVTEGGGHARSWNVDPSRYERAVAEFLSATTK